MDQGTSGMYIVLLCISKKHKRGLLYIHFLFENMIIYMYDICASSYVYEI